MNKSDFKAGQKVFIAYFDSRASSKNRYVEIIKVGNKWITLDEVFRFYPEDVLVGSGDYSSPAIIYLSENKYIDNNKNKKLYLSFKNNIKYSYPENVTIQDLEKALELLKIPMENK